MHSLAHQEDEGEQKFEILLRSFQNDQSHASSGTAQVYLTQMRGEISTQCLLRYHRTTQAQLQNPQHSPSSKSHRGYLAILVHYKRADASLGTLKKGWNDHNAADLFHNPNPMHKTLDEPVRPRAYLARRSAVPLCSGIMKYDQATHSDWAARAASSTARLREV